MEVIDPCVAVLTNAEVYALLERIRESGGSSTPQNLNTLSVELRKYLEQQGLPACLRSPGLTDAEKKARLSRFMAALAPFAEQLTNDYGLNAPQLLSLLNALPDDVNAPNQVSFLLSFSKSTVFTASKECNTLDQTGQQPVSQDVRNYYIPALA